jgi:hypothetical protein
MIDEAKVGLLCGTLIVAVILRASVVLGVVAKRWGATRGSHIKA